MVSKIKFNMMFYACIAAGFLVIAMVVFANYLVALMDPMSRSNMAATDIAGNMVITIVLLCAFAYNAFYSVHWFLKWNTIEND